MASPTHDGGQLCYTAGMPLSEYESMAAYYDPLLEPLLGHLRRQIVTMAQLRPSARVLEIACGTGSQALWFKKAGADYTGVDLSPAMLRAAGKKKLACLHADGTRLPLADHQFDLATITLALHEVEPETRTGIISEMLRVTKPGGHLIVTDYAHPERNNLYTRSAGGVIRGIEKLVGGDHYRNYRLFMAAGALYPFLETFGLELVDQRRGFGGNLAVLKYRTR